MTANYLRPLAAAFLSLSLAACTNQVNAEATPTTPVLGIDLGGAPGRAPPATADISPAPAARAGTSELGAAMVMAHAGHNDVHSTGTVNSVDLAARKVNLSHQPIPKIGWPAMTMDFAVDPSVDLRSLKPGTRINFTIEQGAGGMYEIKALAPAGAGQ